MKAIIAKTFLPSIPSFCLYMYRNDPKFWDKQVWANSVDPDQIALRGAV